MNIASCVGGTSSEGQHVLFSISMWLCNTGYVCAMHVDLVSTFQHSVIT